MNPCADGALGLLDDAQRRTQARLRSGESEEQLAFAGTAFHLPLACALCGFGGGALTEALSIIQHGRALVEQGSPGLGALLAAEVICAVRNESNGDSRWVVVTPAGRILTAENALFDPRTLQNDDGTLFLSTLTGSALAKLEQQRERWRDEAQKYAAKYDSESGG